MSKRIKVGFSIKGLYQYFHMIKPIIDANTSNDITFYIFHTNKYYKYNTPQFEIVNVTVIDLVKTRNIVKLIKEFELDYMIIFNPGQIFDVFITAICKESNTKTIYFQHGLSLPFGSFNIKSIGQGKTMKDKLLSLRRYSYFYRSIVANLFLLAEKRRFLKIILKRTYQVFFLHGRFNYPKYGLKEFHCDLGLVFGKKDKEYLVEKNGFRAEDVLIGGYPMLKAVDNKNGSGLPENYVLYISSGLLKSKVIPITTEDERLFYMGLAKNAKNTGKNIVLKLHPTEDLSLFQEYMRDFNNAFVYKDFNLSNLVANAEIVIGDYSTALFYAIWYRKPLILLRSEFFEKYPFDFVDYGIGEKVYNHDIEQYLTVAPKVDIKCYNDFLLEFISNEDGRDSNEVLYSCILGINKKS